MAFQLPKEPIRNKREFMLYLLATASGVLLALTLERAGAWLHNRSLVAEARENMMQEIAVNRQRIAEWRKTMPEIQKNLEGAIEFADESLRTGRSTKKSVTINFGFLPLSSAAWAAAQSTGALAHMRYQEAKQFAELYDLQDELKRSQSLLFNEMSPVMGIFGSGKDPTKGQRREDLDRFSDRVRTLKMRVMMIDSLAKGLDAACEAIQKRGEGK